MLNRCAVIIRPAEPFIAWALSLDDSGDGPDPNDEQTVYLLPDLADGGDIDDMIAATYEIMFDNELADWHTLEDDWPQKPHARDVQVLVPDRGALGHRGSNGGAVG